MIAERVLMGLLLGGVAVGCLVVLYPFLSALLWAAILTYTTWPMYEWLGAKLRLGRVPAAGVMVAVTAVVVLLPLALAAPAGREDVSQIERVVQDWVSAGLPEAPAWLAEVPAVGGVAAGLWNDWVLGLAAGATVLRPYFGIAAQFGLTILLGLANGVLLFLLALFAAFFFYASGDRMAAQITILLYRIAGPRAERLIAVTGATVRGVVYGILGTALVQGILTALGLWAAGVPRPALLGVIAGGLSVLPIGAPTIWIPAGAWLMATGHTVAGVGLWVYGGVIVSGADTLIRPFFISRGAQLPFLLTMLGVLGGALAFGLLGVFVGPVLLGVGYALVNEWAVGEGQESGDAV